MAAKPKAKRQARRTQVPATKRGGTSEAPAPSALIVPVDYPRAAVELLRSWREGNDEDRREQQETWEFLKHALDADRPSYRKLFP